MLVSVDDIDRLTAEEIRQIFRLMKAVADFPKVTYLLLLSNCSYKSTV
jgi:predicted KAP-like P-loop ATPase